MYIEGLDALDNKILHVIRKNARLSYSEIGEQVGLSRVAVRNRMEAMEEKGIIRGYHTIIHTGNMQQGIHFMMDVEAATEQVWDVLEVLCNDRYIRQVQSTTGNCKFHCQGYAPDYKTLDEHVRYIYSHNKGIRRMEWKFVMTTYKDVDGGVEYERNHNEESM